MNFAMFNSLVLLGVIAGIGFLQVYLSRKESKYLGLILPGLNLIISIFAVLGLVIFAIKLDSNLIIGSLIVLGAYNVPTALLLVIYFICRHQNKNKSEINKINI